MQKTSKNYEQQITYNAKTQIMKLLKSLAIIWKLCIDISFSIYTNSVKIISNEKVSSIGSQLKIIGICYYAVVLKEEKKKHKWSIHINFYENAYCPTNKTSVTS